MGEVIGISLTSGGHKAGAARWLKGRGDRALSKGHRPSPERTREHDHGPDDSFTTDMKSTIAASGRIKGVVAAPNTASLDIESILAAAREQGFDAEVAMQPAEDTQFHMTDPGLSVWRTGGGRKSFTCNSMRIVVLRVSDGNQIASASDCRCPSYSNLPFWHNSWEEYTEEEKGTIFAAMKVFVEYQIDQTLKKPKLHAP